MPETRTEVTTAVAVLKNTNQFEVCLGFDLAEPHKDLKGFI